MSKGRTDRAFVHSTSAVRTYSPQSYRHRTPARAGWQKLDHDGQMVSKRSGCGQCNSMGTPPANIRRCRALSLHGPLLLASAASWQVTVRHKAIRCRAREEGSSGRLPSHSLGTRLRALHLLRHGQQAQRLLTNAMAWERPTFPRCVGVHHAAASARQELQPAALLSIRMDGPPSQRL